jgi:xanthine dehydrogenase YagS FAD-binding subunit
LNNFAYARPRSAQEALGLGAANTAAFIAGGTELLNWMRLGIAAPDLVVDIGRVPELRGIRRDGDLLRIGALATLAEIEADGTVRREAPALAEACLRAASPQVRNRATLGGNVLQRTRCPYFRADAPLPWPCNKREPGSGCAAREGSHQRLAIFGWTDECVATQPSDPIVVLSCLDATIDVVGPGGSRTIAARDFHLTQQEASRMPQAEGRAAQIETRLRAGELIVAYRVPLGIAKRSAYVKVRERESYEYAMVSAAAAVAVDGGVFRAAHVALGSVAQKPWRLQAAERSLVGKPVNGEVIYAAIAEAMKDARPLAGNVFKLRLATNAAVRAVITAVGAT